MRTLWGALLLGLTSLASAAFALPEGGQVIQGNVQISQPGAHILQILQSSPTGIINWGSFSIDANQLVQFLQPDSSAAMLNRVVGRDPSQILGQLQANGRILLVNPNGMLFGPGSSVNAGSFLASTLAIKDADFLQGRYDLSWDGVSPLRAIVNQGEIKVAEGGFLALISPLIDNQGLLLAERGQVILGATRQATLTVDARGLLQVVIPDGFSGPGGGGLQPETVVLTQGQMSDSLAQVVNHYSQQEGGAIVETPQGIQLVGAEGVLLNQGTIGAGSVRLDSSQATVLAPAGGVSGAEIRALSAGGVVQAGGLQGHFVEVSAPRVSMTRAPEVGGGTFLLDPENINIVNAGGVGPDVLFGHFPGSDIDVTASALNVTGAVLLQANQNITFDPGVRVNLGGSTQLHLDAGGDILMQPGSGINATDPGASVAMNATGSVTLRDLQIPTSHIKAGTFVQFRDGTLGQPGSDTLVNATSGSNGTVLYAGSTLDVVGHNVTVDLSSTASNVALGDGSHLNLAGTTSNNLTATTNNDFVYVGQNSTISGASPTDIHFNTASNTILLRDGSSINVAGTGQFNMVSGVNVVLQGGSTINATGPGSRLDVVAGNAAFLYGDVALPTVNVTAGGELDLGGSLGRSGSPTAVNSTGASVIAFSTTLKGSQVDWNLTSTGGGITLVNGANLNVQGNNNHLNWNSAQGILQGSNSTFSADGPTQLGLTSGARTIMGTNSTLSLPNAASNISVNSNGSPAFSRVLSGGRLAVNATAGNNIRISDQVEANDVVLSSPGTLIDDRTDNLPALLAHNSLNVTVANISGPVNDTTLGITQAFPFATGANAKVRFNVTGTNSTLLGNRAGNLYYYFPQSGDLQIVHPLGDVAVYNQPGPPAPAPAPVVPPPAVVGVGLSAVQVEEVTHVGAQSQIQLSNVYSAADLPSTNEVLMLAYDNPSLTRFSLISLSSPLVELVVLSPDAAATRLNDREQMTIFSNEEDEQLRYWRKLIEGFIIWEADY